MGRFGFSEREARLYLALIRRGRATARDLTREVQVDRVLAYRTLDGMRARGLVQTTAERPRKYVPLSPRALFERSLYERRRSVEEDSVLAAKLAEQLPQLTEAISGGAPRFQVLTGAAAIYPQLRDMIREATREVAVMITPRSLRNSARAGIQLELDRLLKAGGRFRMLVDPDPTIGNLLGRFAKLTRRYPKAELRTVSPQRSRLTLVDEKDALVFLVPESTRSGVEETAVWTDTPDFVLAQRAYFAAVWDHATPLKRS